MDLIISIDTNDPEMLAFKLQNFDEAVAQYRFRIQALPPIVRNPQLLRLVQAVNAVRPQILAGTRMDIVFRADDITGRLLRLFTCNVNAAGRLPGDPLFQPYWDGMLANNFF